MRPRHRAQMGVYFLLIEEELRSRPPRGFIVCGGATRHQVENTEELRALMLEVAVQIRAAKLQIAEPIPVQAVPGQCRPCGVREHCGQARL